MPGRPRVVHLDELDAIPGPGTLTWHPVRAHLGIRAFGCNAYSAQREGDDVVEPHTENPEDAHEELYFVARGRATFTLDDETFDAPEGTYVFVPDPATHRHAVATEPGTTVQGISTHDAEFARACGVYCDLFSVDLFLSSSSQPGKLPPKRTIPNDFPPRGERVE